MNLRISDLPELSILHDNDYLVLQNNNKQSYKILFSNFKHALQEKITSKANSCNAMQFAPFAHGHNYSDVWFFPSYTSSDDDVSYCGSFNIAKYFSGENESATYEISVFQPISVMMYDTTSHASVNAHNVGDIQFIASKDFYTYLSVYRKYSIQGNNINIADASFDGFVIPNGTTFNCQANEFQDACKAYSSNHDPFATSFTVPDLNNMFFKCDPGLPASQMTPLSVVSYHNAILNHTHNIIQNGSEMSIKLANLTPIMKKSFKIQTGTINAYYNANYANIEMKNRLSNHIENYFYPGYGRLATKQMANRTLSAQIQPKIEKITLNCNVSEFKCQATGEDSESYPTYVGIQALLYIGKK